jgi:hypothetical protein
LNGSGMRRTHRRGWQVRESSHAVLWREPAIVVAVKIVLAHADAVWGRRPTPLPNVERGVAPAWGSRVLETIAFIEEGIDARMPVGFEADLFPGEATGSHIDALREGGVSRICALDERSPCSIARRAQATQRRATPLCAEDCRTFTAGFQCAHRGEGSGPEGIASRHVRKGVGCATLWSQTNKMYRSDRPVHFSGSAHCKITI